MAKKSEQWTPPQSPLLQQYQQFLQRSPVSAAFPTGAASSSGGSGSSGSASGGSGSGSSSGGDTFKVGSRFSGNSKKAQDAQPGQSALSWLIDIVSRPMYAITGAVNSTLDYQQDKRNFIDTAGGALEGAWKGLTSTDPKDKKYGHDIIDNVAEQTAKERGKSYTPPTLDTVKDSVESGATLTDDGKLSYTPEVLGEVAGMIGRGVGGFALDVALDPLTYVGIGPVVKGVKLAKQLFTKGGQEAAATTAKATAAAGLGAKAATKAEKTAAAPAGKRAVETTDSVEVAAKEAQAAPQGARAAEEVADQVRAEAIASGGRTARAAAPQRIPTLQETGTPASAAVTKGAFGQPVVAPKASLNGSLARSAPKELPKVSETIGTHSSDFVSKLLGVSDHIAERAKGAPAVAQAVEEVAPAAAKAADPNLPGFAKDYFKSAGDDAPALMTGVQLRSGGPRTDIFPSNIVNQLSKSNTQGQLAYLSQLSRIAKAAGEKGAPLVEFLRSAQKHLTDVKAGAVAPLPKAAKGGAAKKISPSDLLHEILRDKASPQRKQLEEALGPELFGKLSRARSATKRDAIFADAVKLARGADEITPQGFDALHADVKGFVESRLDLTRADFDAAARQRQLELELGRASSPGILTKKTARSVPAERTAAVRAFTGLSNKEFLNRWDGAMRRMVGDSFDPKKGKWVGNQYIYSDKDLGVQRVVVDGQLNQFAMTTWFMDTLRAIDKSLPVKAGMDQASAVSKTAARREMIPAEFRAIESEIESAGIKMGSRIDGELVTFKTSNIFDAMEAKARELGPDLGKAFKGRFDRLFWNPGTGAPFSNLMEAFGRSLRGDSEEAIRESLLRMKGSSKTGREYAKRRVFETGGRHLRSSYTGKELLDNAMKLIQELTPLVREYQAGYIAEYVRKSVADASAVATTVEKQVAEAVALGNGPGMAALAGIEKDILELSRQAGASSEAVQLAAESVSKQLPQGLVKRSKRTSQLAAATKNAAASGKSAKEIREMGARTEAKHSPVHDEAVIDEQELADMAAASGMKPEDYYGVGSKVARIQVQTQSALARVFDPFRRYFDVRYGAQVQGIDLYEAVRSAPGVTSRDIYEVNTAIARTASRYNTALLPGSTVTPMSAAFKLLQQGKAGNLSDELLMAEFRAEAGSLELMADAMQEVEQITERFFDIYNVGRDGDMFWQAAGSNIGYLERGWETAGLRDVSVDPFTKALESGAPETFWRTLDIDNPAEFFTKYNAAVHQALSEKVVMDQYLVTMREAGAISDTAKSGFAKPKLEGKSFFYAGLNGADVYVDKQVLDAMSSVDRNLHAARSFGPDSFMSRYIDPVQGAWKTAMTIYRAGHHVRNTLSNAGISYLAEGVRNLGESGVLAAQLLSMRRGGGARGIEGTSEVQRLLTGDGSRLTNGGEHQVAFGVGRGDKRQEVTFGELDDAMTRRGMFRTFAQSEDIIQGTSSWVKKAADAATFRGTWLEHGAGRLSEGLDHHGIAQQFTQIVMNNLSKVGTKQFPTREALYDFAGKRSYRFHPDSMALTAAEAKVPRRLFAFYTWFRGTLPAVLEAAALNPGRAAMFHKASYNIAETLGMDPQSYANPYPVEADVPEYLRERVFGPNFRTPDGTMYSLDPGFAHTDIARQLLGRAPEVDEETGESGSALGAVPGNAMRMLLGMMTPIIKVPAELATGVRFDTGKEIRSTGDYIDDALPGINYLSSSTGISLAGTLLDPGKAIEQGRPVERWPVEQGYQPSIFDEGVGPRQGLKGLNWLFGQGAQLVDTAETKAAADTATKERKALIEQRKTAQ